MSHTTSPWHSRPNGASSKHPLFISSDERSARGEKDRFISREPIFDKLRYSECVRLDVVACHVNNRLSSAKLRATSPPPYRCPKLSATGTRTAKWNTYYEYIAKRERFHYVWDVWCQNGSAIETGRCDWSSKVEVTPQIYTRLQVDVAISS